MKQFTFTLNRQIGIHRLIQTVTLIVLLALTGIQITQAKSYTFKPLGFQNTACSGWERVTDPNRQQVTFSGAVDASESVIGEFWYQYNSRWSKLEPLKGPTYQRTLPNPKVGSYQLCWTHKTRSNKQTTGTLTTIVNEGGETDSDSDQDDVIELTKTGTPNVTVVVKDVLSVPEGEFAKVVVTVKGLPKSKKVVLQRTDLSIGENPATLDFFDKGDFRAQSQVITFRGGISLLDQGIVDKHYTVRVKINPDNESDEGEETFGVWFVIDRSRSTPGLPIEFENGKDLSLVSIRDLDGWTDIDGDQVPDSEDVCLYSDLSPTVDPKGCDTGVSNLWFANGCAINDLVKPVFYPDSDDTLDDLFERLEAEGTLSKEDGETIFDAIFACEEEEKEVEEEDLCTIADDDLSQLSNDELEERFFEEVIRDIEERWPSAFDRFRPTDYRAHRYYFEKYNNYRNRSAHIAELADEIDRRIKDGTLEGERVPPGSIWQLTPAELHDYKDVYSDAALKRELNRRIGWLTPAQLRLFDFTSEELTAEFRRREPRIRKRASKEYRKQRQGLLIDPEETEEEYIHRILNKELSPLLELIEEVETEESGGIIEVDPDSDREQCPPNPIFQP